MNATTKKWIAAGFAALAIIGLGWYELFYNTAKQVAQVQVEAGPLPTEPAPPVPVPVTQVTDHPITTILLPQTSTPVAATTISQPSTVSAPVKTVSAPTSTSTTTPTQQKTVDDAKAYFEAQYNAKVVPAAALKPVKVSYSYTSSGKSTGISWHLGSITLGYDQFAADVLLADGYGRGYETAVDQDIIGNMLINLGKYNVKTGTFST